MKIERRERQRIRESAIRRPACLLLLAMLVHSALACATAEPAPPPEKRTNLLYRVGPPDQLHVSILPEPTIERAVLVRPDGFISVDLIGDVPASGLTTEEIARGIEKKISRYKRDARVTVSLVSSNSNAITIFGEVIRPSAISLQHDTRVAEAIGTVGGPTTRANRKGVRVIRSHGSETMVYTVNLKDIQEGDLSTNLMVAGGDIIVIPATRLARAGYWFQTLLFPFQPLISVATSAAAWGAF